MAQTTHVILPEIVPLYQKRQKKVWHPRWESNPRPPVPLQKPTISLAEVTAPKPGTTAFDSTCNTGLSSVHTNTITLWFSEANFMWREIPVTFDPSILHTTVLGCVKIWIIGILIPRWSFGLPTGALSRNLLLIFLHKSVQWNIHGWIH